MKSVGCHQEYPYNAFKYQMPGSKEDKENQGRTTTDDGENRLYTSNINSSRHDYTSGETTEYFYENRIYQMPGLKKDTENKEGAKPEAMDNNDEAYQDTLVRSPNARYRARSEADGVGDVETEQNVQQCVHSDTHTGDLHNNAPVESNCETHLDRRLHTPENHNVSPTESGEDIYTLPYDVHITTHKERLDQVKRISKESEVKLIPKCTNESVLSISSTSNGGFCRVPLSNGEDLYMMVPEGAIKDKSQEIVVISSNSCEYCSSLPHGTERMSMVLSLEPHGTQFNDYIFIKFKVQCNDDGDGLLLYSDTRFDENPHWQRLDGRHQNNTDILWSIDKGYCYLYVKHFCQFCIVKDEGKYPKGKILLASLYGWYEEKLLQFAVAFQDGNRKPNHSKVNEWFYHPVMEQPFIFYPGYGDIHVKLTISVAGNTLVMQEEQTETQYEAVLSNIENLPVSPCHQFIIGSSESKFEQKCLVATVTMKQEQSTDVIKIQHPFNLHTISTYEEQFYTVGTNRTVDSGFSTGGSSASTRRSGATHRHYQRYLESIEEQHTPDIPLGDNTTPKYQHLTLQNQFSQNTANLDFQRGNGCRGNVKKETLQNVPLSLTKQNQIANILDPHWRCRSKLWVDLVRHMNVSETLFGKDNAISPTKVLLMTFLSQETNGEEDLIGILSHFSLTSCVDIINDRSASNNDADQTARKSAATARPRYVKI